MKRSTEANNLRAVLQEILSLKSVQMALPPRLLKTAQALAEKPSIKIVKKESDDAV